MLRLTRTSYFIRALASLGTGRDMRFQLVDDIGVPALRASIIRCGKPSANARGYSLPALRA